MHARFERKKPTAVARQFLVGAALSLGLISAQPVQAQQQCSTYRVVPGDTLGRIAVRGNVRGGFQALFSANSNVLFDPNLIEVGEILQIPCADGSLPSNQNNVVATARAESVARPLRIVTGSGYAPFTDEKLEGGGALTKMVRQAIEQGNPDQEFSITFVNDWGSHLDSLLPLGAMDMTFPWYRPDCSRIEFLSPSSAFRCTGFNHSEPLYDALVGFYTLNGSQYANAASYEDIKGARLCRPEDWFTHDLEAEQLVPPNVEMTRPVPQDGCWQLLLDGEIDIVTLDALPAEEDYRELGLADQVTNITALSSKQTLHVFVSKDNALANEALPIINAGLENLRLSGEWFEIVRSGILETIEN